MRGGVRRRDPPEVETLHPRPHRLGHLVRLGGGEHEQDVRGRLLQGLEERVPCLGGEHVRLVDDVDLATQRRRQVLHLVAQVAHLVDAAIAGGVDLEDVNRAAVEDLQARCALVAGLTIPRRQAVDRPRQDPSGRGLAGAADPGEQVRMRKRPGPHLVAQSGRDDVLPHQVREPSRPVTTIEGSGHGLRVAGRRGARDSLAGARHTRVLLQGFAAVGVAANSPPASSPLLRPAADSAGPSCAAPQPSRSPTKVANARKRRKIPSRTRQRRGVAPKSGCVRSNSLRPDEGENLSRPVRTERGSPTRRSRVGAVAHPTSLARRRRSPDRSARTRFATAPPGDRLPLLPSGPDGVRRPGLRRTRSSTPMRSEQTQRHAPSVGNSTPL